MSNSENKYRENFNAFMSDVWFAARALQYHISLNEKTTENSKILEKINENSRFWQDFRFSNLAIAIITLGRIFDDDSDAHSMTKMLRKVYFNLDFFSKKSLKARKRHHIPTSKELKST